MPRQKNRSVHSFFAIPVGGGQIDPPPTNLLTCNSSSTFNCWKEKKQQAQLATRDAVLRAEAQLFCVTVPDLFHSRTPSGALPPGDAKVPRPPSFPPRGGGGRIFHVLPASKALKIIYPMFAPWAKRF